MYELQKTVQVSLLTLVGLLSVQAGVAQVPADSLSSIGFTHPDSTQPVRAYRLPTWHWSRWTLRGNGEADWATNETSGILSAGVSVRPRYEGFWESEERRASLYFAPAVSLSGRSETFDDNSDYGLSLDSEGILREYVGRRIFLLVEGRADLSYYRSRLERSDGSTRTQISSDVELDARLGVGVGRVRIVTPVIRALRVRKRLRTVAPGASVSDEQVQDAAQQLARAPGYAAVYDRPDKYFWRDFFERVGLSGRSPFETFYVADVLREPVGVRREGGEVQIGASALYGRTLDRAERGGTLDERQFSEGGTVGAFARGQWYRNVTLHHQLGVDAEVTYTKFVTVNSPNYHEFGTVVEGQWLWVLADRVRLDTRLRPQLNFKERQRLLRESDYLKENRYVLSSNLLVFVENSLSLSVGGNVSYRYSWGLGGGYSESLFSAGLQFQIKYVLSRALR